MTDLNVYAPALKVLSVRCPYCYALPGERCIIAGDPLRPRKRVHMERVDSAGRQHRSRQMWYVLKDDDTRFGLRAGDIVRCVKYPWDSKVSVMFREWDGYDPECNQYMNDVSFLGFVPLDMETRS